MKIRHEDPADIESIHQIHAAAFPTEAEANLVRSLREAGNLTISMVAETEAGQLVGHVAYSPVRVNLADVSGLGLAPIAVLPEHQQRGIGTELMFGSWRAAEELKIGFIVVLGDPIYYGRFGFEPASRWQLEDEYGGGEAFQAIELISGSIPKGGGIVSYSAEFDALG